MDTLKNIVGNLATNAYLLSQKLPKSVRLLLRDMLEGAAAAVAGIQLFVPQSEEQARSLAVTIAVAAAAAAIAVVRRYIWNLILSKVSPSDGG